MASFQTPKLSVLALALALATTSVVSAETREEKFARIDADHDGAITFEEHTAADQAEMRKIDADGDGSVSLGEYVEHLKRLTPGVGGPAVASVARCYFRTVDQKAGDSVPSSAVRAFDDRIFRWLAGADGRMSLEESKRTPPPDIIPRVVCG